MEFIVNTILNMFSSIPNYIIASYILSFIFILIFIIVHASCNECVLGNEEAAAFMFVTSPITLPITLLLAILLTIGGLLIAIDVYLLPLIRMVINKLKRFKKVLDDIR